MKKNSFMFFFFNSIQTKNKTTYKNSSGFQELQCYFINVPISQLSWLQTFFPLNNSCCFINLYKVFFFFKKKHCINTIPLMGHNLPQLPTTLGLVTSLSPLHRANFLKLLAHIPQCNSCYPYHIMDIFFNLSLFLV